MILDTLIKLGLTPDEASLYLFLINNKMLIPQQIATKLHKHVSALSRLGKSLEKKGFIVIEKSKPVYYRFIHPQIAVERYVKYQQNNLEQLKLSSLYEFNNNLVYRKELYIKTFKGEDIDRSINEYVDQSNKEILVITKKEGLSDEETFFYRKAVNRKVLINLIINSVESGNNALHKELIEIGVQVKYFQYSQYNLLIFDSIRCILISNPNSKDQRTALLIYDPGLASAMRTFFYTIWDKSKEIRL